MQEYVVQVINNEIVGHPVLKSQIQQGYTGMQFLPCNYGEFRPGLDMISKGEIKGNEVVYIIMPIPDSAILDSLKKTKEKEIRVIGEEKLKAIAGPYRQTERETWGYQLTEAEAFLQNAEALTPTVDAIALNRGITKEDLVSKILENANLFRVYSGSILGEQQNKLDQIYSATTAEQVNSITWA